MLVTYDFLVSDLIKELDSEQGNRDSIIFCIDEYNSLVNFRSRFNFLSSNPNLNNNTTSVEGVLSRFADDAVNTTYGLVWNAVGTPFTVYDKTDPSRDLSDLAKILIDILENRASGFKQALRYCLKNYLEYGSAWLYVLPARKNKGLKHRVFSLKEIKRKKDMYLDLDAIFLIRSIDQKLYTFCKRKDDNSWDIHQKNSMSSYIESEFNIKYCPILELSLSGTYSDIYPIGYGLKALADLKRYDNIVKALTETAGDALKPIFYTSSTVNASNKTNNPINSAYLGSKYNPLIVDEVVQGARSPVGWIPTAAASADAWRVFEIVSVSLRESFNFINRLLTIKDNTQMTATEAQIRSNFDVSQVRDTIEGIFSFLNDVHRVQLHILKKQGMLKDFKDIDIDNLVFNHSSIFKREDENTQIQKMNAGLDLTAKLVQVATLLKQAGVSSIDTQKMIQNIAEMTEIELSTGDSSMSALSQILQSFESQSVSGEGLNG